MLVWRTTLSDDHDQTTAGAAVNLTLQQIVLACKGQGPRLDCLVVLLLLTEDTAAEILTAADTGLGLKILVCVLSFAEIKHTTETTCIFHWHLLYRQKKIVYFFDPAVHH